MFKKICIFVFLFVCSFLLTPGVHGQSTDTTPNYISEVSISKTEVEGGSTETAQIKYSNAFPNNDKLFIEYGVAREINRGNVTYFENLSTEVKPAKDAGNSLSISVPNISSATPKASYVVYIKTYIENDPDSEQFIVSKAFGIKPSTADFILVKYSNLLQSNGSRFELNYGPSIYSPADSKEDSMPTGTSLELTLESNTTEVLNPTISFTKLRSDKFSSEVTVNPITLKNGDTFTKIDLPTFNYEPGVYLGTLKFNNSKIKDSIKFQYIVAGDSVTVGQVTYKDAEPNHSFVYEIFGTPIDLENIELASGTKTYNVTLDYMKGSKVVLSDTQTVDFKNESFESLVSKEFNKIDTVAITVKSADGKVVYEGSKDLNVNNAGKSNMLMWILIGLAILAIILLIVRKLNKNNSNTTATAVGATMAIILFAAGATQVFAVWNPPATFVTSSLASKYVAEDITFVPTMQFGEDLSTKVYQTGENLEFMFKTTLLTCNNVNHSVKTGFSTVSGAKAIADRTQHFSYDDTNNSSLVTTEDSVSTTVGVHTFYNRVSPFARANVGPITRSTTHIYTHVYHDVLEKKVNSSVDGYSNYKIPLRVAPAVPSKPAATLNGCSSVGLSWTAVPGATSYKVYKSIDGGPVTLLTTVATNSYPDTAIVAGKTYVYSVASYNDSATAESNKSEGVSILVPADCAAPLSCDISPASPKKNEPITWTAKWSSAFDPSTEAGTVYAWTGDVTAGNVKTVTKTFTEDGTKTANLSATRGGVPYTASCPVNLGPCGPGTVWCPITSSCLPTGTTCASNLSCNVSRDITDQRRVNWSVNLISGSALDYNFSWTGDVVKTGQSVAETYSAIDTRTSTVVVTHKTTGASESKTCTIGGCTGSTVYCAATNSCTTATDCGGTSGGGPGGPTCGTRGGVAVGGIARVTDANLCGAGSEVVPGSFGLSIASSKWSWTCRKAGATSGSISCSTVCVPPSVYNPVKGYCGDETCPDWCTNIEGLQPSREKYIIDEDGNCLADGRIVYFRPKPDTNATFCPAFWKTETDLGSRMDCKINGVTVPSQKLDETGIVGYPIAAGVRHTLTCEVRNMDSDTLIKTVSSSVRCYKPNDVREQ